MFKKKVKNFKQLSTNISLEDNEKNLFFFLDFFKNIEYFIFFGTLLGITRDNGLIDGDDDIDFMVDYKSKKKLLKKMTLNKTFKINKKVSNDYFVQYVKKNNGLITIGHFTKNPNKLNYIYIITPKGIAEKTKLTVAFMKRKMNEYDELKREIDNEKQK